MKVGYHSNIITGCTILDIGKEHNVGRCIDRVTLNDSNGNFIRSVQELNHQRRSFYDVTSIDTNTIALSIGSRVFIVDIYTQSIVHIIKNNRYCTCLGITHCDGKLISVNLDEIIRRFDLKTTTHQLLVQITNIDLFSYISCDGNRLFYTSNTATVGCFDMNGKQIWRFEDTSCLRSAQGVVVDNEDFVFVAGEQSGNVVVISPDGISSKEVDQIPNPRPMCYDKNENKILVCNTDNKASWF